MFTDLNGDPPGLEGVGTISGVVQRTGGFPQSGAEVSAGGASSSENAKGLGR